MFVEELFSYEEYLRKEKQKNYYYYYNTNDNYSMHICNKMQKNPQRLFVCEEQSTNLAFITPSCLQKYCSKMFI